VDPASHVLQVPVDLGGSWRGSQGVEPCHVSNVDPSRFILLMKCTARSRASNLVVTKGCSLIHPSPRGPVSAAGALTNAYRMSSASPVSQWNRPSWPPSRCQRYPLPIRSGGPGGLGGRVSYKGSGVSQVEGFSEDDTGIEVTGPLMPTAMPPRGQETRAHPRTQLPSL
jgi:hypothetical protein